MRAYPRLFAALLALCVLASCAPAHAGEHFASASRDFGPSGRFLGRIQLTPVFVSTPGHPWTEEKRQEWWDAWHLSADFIGREAARYGAEISLSAAFYETEIPMEYDSELGWYWYLMRNYFLAESMTELQRRVETEYQADDAPHLFLFNSAGRSHAYASARGVEWNEEFSVLFCGEPIVSGSITHELLHLYGAIDLYDYELEEVQPAAAKQFPSSVMLSINGEIDELTAWLIGWTDTKSRRVTDFLEETAGLR